MLEAIQKEYPETELYFVTGSDKLVVLPRWHRIDEFLERFGILVARRGEEDMEKIKDSDEGEGGTKAIRYPVRWTIHGFD